MTRKELGFRAAGLLGKGFLMGMGSTWRYEIRGREVLEPFLSQGKPFILAFWHSRILPLSYLHRGDGIVVLVSEHRDGEYITRIVERMGLRTARGSSTRGGARGLRGIVRAARDGHSMAFTPDGPKGPPRVFKPGALVAAKLSGAPVVPLAAGASRAWRAASWDRFEVPKPFARIRVRYGEPHYIPRDADDTALDGYAATLEAALNRATDEVDRASLSRESAPTGRES